MKYVVAFLIVVCAGCKYDTITSLQSTQGCPTALTVTQFPWIMRAFNPGCGVCAKDVYTSTYKGQPIVYIPCGGPACDCLAGMFLYDCQGNLVKQFTNSPADIVDAQVNLAPLVKIYSCN